MLTQNPSPSYETTLPLREPPHNIQAEKALLGALLVFNEAMDRLPAMFAADHFFDPLHGQIFFHIAKVAASGRVASPVTLRTYFEHAEPIDDRMTVPQYLGHLAANATTIINVKDYAQAVMDAATRRALIVIGEDMVAAAYGSLDVPPDEQITEAEAKLSLAAAEADDDRCQTFASTVLNVLEQANAAYQRHGHLSGISTGLTDLDNRLGGLHQSDLVILAGRPSMGKTSLATNIAWSVARSKAQTTTSDGEIIDEPQPVGFFSLEMSGDQLTQRILASEASLSSEKIRRGMINEDEFRRLVTTSHDVSDAPLHIDDRGGVTIGQLAARARRMKRKHGIRLLVIDYLQLMSGTKKARDGAVAELTEITMGLKALAKELQIPVIALSQLSRGVEGRDDKRPQLSDLRGSGSIEQDADVVMFVYRAEYYVERKKPDEADPKYSEWFAEMQKVAGKAEVIIGKQRHGPVGIVPLAFDAQFTRFGNLAREHQLPERYE